MDIKDNKDFLGRRKRRPKENADIFICRRC